MPEEDAIFAVKRDVRGRVAENVPAGRGFFRMRLLAPELAGAFRPGQFFQLRPKPGREAPFLRRPFAPSSHEPDGFSFFYAVVGKGTRLLAELPAGTAVDILAPLGNAYSRPPAGAAPRQIGGGAGAPGLVPLAEQLRNGGVRTILALGARTAESIPRHPGFASVPDRLLVATDDGGRGFRGTVLAAIRADPDNPLGQAPRLYACGPVPMLAAAAELAAERGLACEVSLEERMACGFGACMGCVAPILDAGGGNSFRRICRDGPVFDAGLVDWGALSARR
jgi:dihydroorotate dehydrogenase electron transfer subunit